MSAQNNCTIMLIDDNPLLREELRQFIEEEPDLKVCGEAENGLELLGHLNELKNDRQELPQLIVLDISMPYFSGLETARQLRLMYPSIKILFLSNHDSKEYLKYALAGGAEGYLLKSVMDTELIPAIRTICSGASYNTIADGECYDAGAHRGAH
jgi:two-component system, NarL family, response regulator DegU